jgi:lipoate---protein ligase
MLFIENPSSDPYFNLALEEYLLKHFDTEIAMIWSSKSSIIVGKHQNTLGEINFDYVRKNNIPVVRRLSGGGTVFHDPGNINFTFIRKAARDKLVDFKAHTQPIVDFLRSLQIDARLEGKNDIRVNGLKVSGNAEHVFRDKVMHHGTLLFDSNIEHLNLAIKAKEGNFESKAVKSIRSTVTNISDFCGPEILRDVFVSQLKSYIQKYFGNIDLWQPGNDDIRAIQKIKDEKYITWEWNFGYSPAYTFRNSGVIDKELLFVELTVARGIVTETKLMIHESVNSFDRVEHDLLGAAHKPDVVEEILRLHNFMGINQMNDHWILLGLFF